MPSPQYDHASFPLIITALDLNDQPLTRVTPDITLSALDATEVAIPVTPTTAPDFAGHLWNGAVRVTQPATGVRVRVTCPTATAETEAFDVLAGPRLAFSPSSLAVTAPAGEKVAATVTLSNTGNAALDYQATTAVGAAASASSTSPQRPASTPGLAADAAPAALEDILAVVNGGYAEVTSLIPNRYDFRDGVTGFSINDGGNDMYDDGNFLHTDLSASAQFIAYSDNAVTSAAAHLGPTGRYFTRKQPGLFVFAADLDGASMFEIVGNLGADGTGQVDQTKLTTVRDGVTWAGFVKRVHSANDPSVNHLIITPDQPSLTHAISLSTDSDQHTIAGLTGQTRLYHLLFASTYGGYINDATMQTLFETFLDLTRAANWLSVHPASGQIPIASSTDLTITSDAAALEPGVYPGAVSLASTDPTAQPPPSIPVTFTVTSPVHHFTWAPLTGPLQDDTAFTTSLQAETEAGQLVSDFQGTAQLSARVETADAMASGTGSAAVNPPFNAALADSRMQALYLPSEIGPARRLVELQIPVTSSPNQTLRQFTIRIRHSDLTDFSSTADAAWISSGWTTVYQADLPPPTVGMLSLPLTTPFDYNGSQSLLVDISFDGLTIGSGGGSLGTVTSSPRMLSATAANSQGAPASWTGKIPAPIVTSLIPNITFVGHRLLPVSPSSITFTNGTWSGSLIPLEPASAVRFQAERFSGTRHVIGLSDGVEIQAIPVPSLDPEPAFTSGMENTLTWDISLGGEFRLERATSADFSDAISSPWIAIGSHTFTDLNDGQTYYYRLHRRQPAPITDLTPLGSFSESTPSASVSSTQDASAPLITSEIGDGRTFFTLRAQPSLSGTAWDLSGLDFVTINDETVTTSDAFANWSHSLTLALGSHACTLNATDLASPTPNHLTWNFTLERLADEDGDALPGFWEDAHGLSDLSALGDDGTLGDRDLDGMSNLLEFAFNQSPISPGASPCRCETLINPEDGQSYFQLRYPRRIDSIDLRYRVTASLDA
ncbi:MAG: hypothetical protein KDK99_19595, partial [Verrucomicrobiales bacterium]|nr:hypothetical protein [Verrucomicrobiales bacterium]